MKAGAGVGGGSGSAGVVLALVRGGIFGAGGVLDGVELLLNVLDLIQDGGDLIVDLGDGVSVLLDGLLEIFGDLVGALDLAFEFRLLGGKGLALRAQALELRLGRGALFLQHDGFKHV